MKTSLIYCNIFCYRLVMNLLYQGRYEERFRDVADLLDEDDTRVVELCFGDTLLGEQCCGQGRDWTGFDINPCFVARAVRKNLDAIRADIREIDALPRSDVCIMVGSLYHFHGELETVLTRMLAAAPKVIISEPVVNLAAGRGPMAWLAKRMSDAGSGPEEFRFDQQSLTAALAHYCRKHHLTCTVISRKRDLLVTLCHA